MYAVIGSAQGEITEKRSRFIARIKEIHNEEEASAFIEAIRKEYWDARHNCYAYVLGRNNELQRFSDDGEPQGTAGRPILDVLMGADIRNAVIVVTRYFGGTLLGTGGLIRAYTDSSLAAVGNLNENDSAGKLLPILEGHLITFSCDYSDINRFESLAAKYDLRTVSKDYLEKAIYKMVIESSALGRFLSEANDLTRGAFALDSDEEVCFCPDEKGAILYSI